MSTARVISESKSIADLLSKVSHNSWVFLDLDETVMTSELGDQWFTCLCKLAAALVKDKNKAMELVLTVYCAIQFHAKTQPVESSIVKIIQRLQDIGVPVIALTARGDSIKDATIRQLKHIGVDFSRNCSEKDKIISLSKDEKNQFSYHHGIIYCNGNDKGLCMTAFLEKCEHHPQHIIMVDDKQKHLESIQKAVDTLKIPFHGFRYGHLDKEAEKFDFNVVNQKLMMIKSLDPSVVKALQELNLHSTTESTEEKKETAYSGIFQKPAQKTDVEKVDVNKLQVPGKFTRLTRSKSM